MKAKAVTIARYDFVNKKGLAIKTTKLIVSLGKYGTFITCSELANEIPLFEEIDVVVGQNPKLNKNDGLFIQELL